MKLSATAIVLAALLGIACANNVYETFPAANGDVVIHEINIPSVSADDKDIVWYAVISGADMVRYELDLYTDSMICGLSYHKQTAKLSPEHNGIRGTFPNLAPGKFTLKIIAWRSGHEKETTVRAKKNFEVVAAQNSLHQVKVRYCE